MWRIVFGWGLATVLALSVTAARADQVIADDLIVQGSTCVGADCVDNESFGFDTLRFKAGDIRLKFDDTSTSVGFPNHDWEILINESATDGLNRFSILEDTAGTTPFTILGGAPTNSLFIDAAGKVGLGTANPAATLDVVGNANVSGTLTAATFTLPTNLSATNLSVTGAMMAASVDVDGNAGVSGDLDVTGTINGRDLAADAARLDALAAGQPNTKSGVIPIAEFSKRKPSKAVVFQTSYGPNDVYVVVFTVVMGKGRQPVPYLTGRDANGFTVALGSKKAGSVTEVQWFTRLVGE